ncbi:MAG: hypothetical protein AMJ64_10895 [Betaproteobacteria bacterium SG8_39]|nr:MAG: hypothetical protein AMJ64_10895 [Betaproteobacteria bacterium SG8_39]
MRLINLLFAAVLAWAPAAALGFGSSADEDDGFAHMLALMQSVVSIAAQSEDPKAVERRMDEVFAGQNPEANRAAEALLEDMTRDMSDAERQSFLALARDLVVLARPLATFDTTRALAARKELNAMGLRYYDAEQFLDAVKRDDALAVALYIEGRGVNLAARDADGRTALEIAQTRGNRQIVGMLGGGQ